MLMLNVVDAGLEDPRADKFPVTLSTSFPEDVLLDKSKVTMPPETEPKVRFWILSVPAVPVPAGEIRPYAPFIIAPWTVPAPCNVCVVEPDPRVKPADSPETLK